MRISFPRVFFKLFLWLELRNWATGIQFNCACNYLHTRCPALNHDRDTENMVSAFTDIIKIVQLFYHDFLLCFLFWPQDTLENYLTGIAASVSVSSICTSSYLFFPNVTQGSCQIYLMPSLFLSFFPNFLAPLKKK